MSMFEPDVYYNPERFGLTPVGDIEWAGESYQFDITAVWKDKDGTFYWADDTGCSCPSPFEDYTSIEKLHSGTSHAVAAHITERLASLQEQNFWADGWGQTQEQAEAQVVSLVAKIMGG